MADSDSAKTLLEAALFISPKPLMLNDLGKIAGIGSMGHVRKMLEDLQKEYSGKGIEVVSTPAGWRMQASTKALPTVAHLTPYSDIPEGCKRTLALVVYKEPFKQSELIKIQGNKAYAYIKFLEKKGMVKAEKYGRTKLLKVTKEFETYFGEPKEKIREKIAQGISALEGQEAAKRLKPSQRTLADDKIGVLKEIEGLGDFFSRLDRPSKAEKNSAVASKAAAAASVAAEPEAEKPGFKVPRLTQKIKENLDELSVDEFKVVKKEVKQ